MDGDNGKGIERLNATRVAAWLRKPGRDAATLKLADGAGLYLVRLASGAASWRIKYRLAGVEKSFSIGPASEVSLADARAERRRVKALIKEGIDPVQDRRVARATRIASTGHLFRDVANAWLQKQKASPQKKGWSAVHFEKSQRAIERDVTPWLGALPISAITPSMISAVVDRVQHRGARDTAGKILQHVGSIFRFAAAKGMRNDNPADACSEILTKADDAQHYAALLTFPELGDVLRRADAAPISEGVRLAHKLIAHSAVRVANAVQAEWKEFDLDASPALWTIPRAKMKSQGKKHDHRVILTDVIADELRAWRKRVSGEYVFPGRQGGKHISRESIEKMLRETVGLEGKHSPHSWRSAFSTLAKESGAFTDAAVNLALDHVNDSVVARSYDRGERLGQRIKLMQWWGSELARAQAHVVKVTPIKRKKVA
jgi:integrase